MKYPIVKVQTKDKIMLHGLFIEAPKAKSVLLHTHGTADSFYGEDFVEFLTKECIDNNISFLSCNNRGSSTLEIYQNIGASMEHFEKCILDFDAWIEFLRKKGYKNIFLSGHSLGTEKVVYYANNGKHKSFIKGFILISFADSYGFHMEFLKKMKNDLLAEAKKLITEKKGNQFLRSIWKSHAGVLPASATSYLNFFGSNSKLLKALPFHQNKLKDFSKINTPMLGVIGDQEEYTVIPIKKSIELLKKENSNISVYQFKNCDHDYSNKESELARLVVKFIKSINR